MVCSRYSSWQEKICRSGYSRAEHRDLGVPAAHVPHPVLGPEHPFLAGDLQLGVQVVGGLGVVRVLEQDLRQPGLLPDGAVAVLRGAVLVAEPQPAVRRVGQGGLGAGVDGPLGLLDGDLGALSGDAGDDRDLVTDLGDQRLDDLDLLVLGQEGALAGVPEHDQRLHTLDRGQELAQVGQCGVVHVAVDRERGDRGRVQATQVQISERHRRLLLRKLCGNVPVCVGLDRLERLRERLQL